jgi:poly(A) polymerase
MTTIAHASWLKSPETRAVIAALDSVRLGASRFVGGCVRNTLMGRPIDDIDIATQLLPDAVIEAGRKAGLAAHPTGIEHGTITLVSNHVPYEITTLRRDVSTDGRRATVAFTEAWEEDAERRDFRMNALYAGADGEIFDPTGGGIGDIRAGLIKFIGDPEARIREDYLRILRFFRFNAWYGAGAPDSDGLAACAKLRDGLATLSVERVWKELKKTLAAADPRIGVAALFATGAHAIAWPEASQRARLDALLAFESELALPADAMTRLAAALEDQAAARALAQRLKLSNEERARLVAALGDDERITSFMSMREVRRALYRIGAEAFIDRAKIAWAEAGGDKAQQWIALIELAKTWVRPNFPLSGEEVMAAGVPAGPKIGAVLREVEIWWIDSDFTADKLSIVERLKAVAQGMA